MKQTRYPAVLMLAFGLFLSPATAGPKEDCEAAQGDAAIAACTLAIAQEPANVQLCLVRGYELNAKKDVAGCQ
jgi:hypothetical protein